MTDLLRKLAFAAALLALNSPASAQAGTATANLTVQIQITASCTINAASLTFTSTASTSLTSAAVTGSTTVAVTCSNTSPYSIGMGQGANYTSSNRMASGSNYLPYTLYTDSGYTHPWTTGATSTTCTVANQCYLGTGNGSAQSVTIYGQVPVTAAAPAPGTYSDTVLMTITY
jgi:spore coat protein U-like protein